MELIDAVDADGDGRGELLFRRTFDGSAYAIYRVTADGLWPLFEPNTVRTCAGVRSQVSGVRSQVEALSGFPET
jgi:hypothetical protein